MAVESKTPWAPGPWHTDAAGLVYCEAPFLGKCTVAQCEIAPLPEPGKMGILLGNARLIAKAPVMAEMLDRFAKSGLLYSQDEKEVRALLQQIRGDK